VYGIQKESTHGRPGAGGRVLESRVSRQVWQEVGVRGVHGVQHAGAVRGRVAHRPAQNTQTGSHGNTNSRAIRGNYLM